VTNMPSYDALAVSGEKNPVVLDVGGAYTKCGFAGENGPRFIIPSEVKPLKTKKTIKIHEVADDEELYSVLIEFVHYIFFRQLLVNPKDRKIVVVESILSTSRFRSTLSRVLFKQFEVMSVGFATSHVVALLTVGIPSGLVLDCGYTETLVLPVYEGIPLLSCCRALPIAGKAIHQHVETLLKETSTVKIGRRNVPLSAVADALSESILEDIKVRSCFVTRMSRAKELLTDAPPAPPQSVDYPLDGSKLLHVDGRLRERACEVLFERDGEDTSVATLVLDSLVKCPVDTRRALAENIVLMGGTAMLPGFRARLMGELSELILTPKYKDRLGMRAFKLHSPPAKENYVAWLGGAIFGALDVLSFRSLSREQYVQGVPIPDWCLQYSQEDNDDKSITAK